MWNLVHAEIGVCKINSNAALELSKCSLSPFFFFKFVTAVGHHSVIKVEESRDAIREG